MLVLIIIFCPETRFRKHHAGMWEGRSERKPELKIQIVTLIKKNAG